MLLLVEFVLVLIFVLVPIIIGFVHICQQCESANIPYGRLDKTFQ